MQQLLGLLSAVVLSTALAPAPQAFASEGSAPQRLASEESAVMAVVRQWVGAFGKPESKLALAACAKETVIIDDLPPYAWSGRGACSKWQSDFKKYLASNEISEPSATLLKPWQVTVTGDHAYVVVPINFSYKVKKKQVREIGSVLTVTLQRASLSWRIAAWAMAAH